MDDDLKAELAELERLAKEATPGPWAIDADDMGRTIVASPVSIVARDARHNSEFIAAANPATVLRLISALRQRDEALEDLLPALSRLDRHDREMFADEEAVARAILTGSETNAR